MGEIKPLSRNFATFRLTNTGDATLHIGSVTKCCGAAVKLDKEEIAPGETCALIVDYVAPQDGGALRRSISFATNDPKNPRVDLTITGKVVATLAWTPTRFEIAPYTENVVCPEIKLKSLDGKPFAIKGFSATGECLTADFDPNNKASEFAMKLKADRAKLQSLTVPIGLVKIQLVHPDYQAIYVEFRIKRAVEISPAGITVFNAERGQPVIRALQLQDNRTGSNGDVSACIESVAFKNGSRVETRGVTKAGKGCEINLALWPAEEKKSESFWNDELLVRLKGGPLLTVPVHVFYKIQAVSSEKNPASSL
jgi:hypothetical protein